MTDHAHRSIRVLVFHASLRKDSENAKLADLALSSAERAGREVDGASIAEFDCPSYDPDVEREKGIPPGARVGV